MLTSSSSKAHKGSAKRITCKDWTCLEDQVTTVTVIQASCWVLTESALVLPSGGEASMVRRFLKESAVSPEFWRYP